MQPAEKLEGVDRRQHERAGLKTFVHLGSESNFYTGLSNDISEGGLFVATHDLLAHGAVVDLEFSLGEHDYKVKVQGAVRWVREYNRDCPDVRPGMGVQFLNLSQEDRAAIKKFVKTREALFYEE
jgi:uncharacterized protein (TIGR02266 family)